MRRCCGSQGQGGDLVAAAAALAILLAQGRTAEEIELLSALFDIVADGLGLLALKAPSWEDCDDCRGNCQSESENRGRCP